MTILVKDQTLSQMAEESYHKMFHMAAVKAMALIHEVCDPFQTRDLSAVNGEKAIFGCVEPEVLKPYLARWNQTMEKALNSGKNYDLDDLETLDRFVVGESSGCSLTLDDTEDAIEHIDEYALIEIEF